MCDVHLFMAQHRFSTWIRKKWHHDWFCSCCRSAAPAPVLLSPWPPPRPRRRPQVWSREWRPRGWPWQLLWLRVPGVPGWTPRAQSEPQGVSGGGLLLPRDVSAPSSTAHDPPRASGPFCWPRLGVAPGARVPRPPWSPRAPHDHRLWWPDARQPHTSQWWSPPPSSWRWALFQFYSDTLAILKSFIKYKTCHVIAITATFDPRLFLARMPRTSFQCILSSSFIQFSLCSLVTLSCVSDRYYSQLEPVDATVSAAISLTSSSASSDRNSPGAATSPHHHNNNNNK